MKVVFVPEVEEDLYELIEVLIAKDYLGTYPFAISYVEDLISDIQRNINSKLKKKVPTFFERYAIYYLSKECKYYLVYFFFNCRRYLFY